MVSCKRNGDRPSENASGAGGVNIYILLADPARCAGQLGVWTRASRTHRAPLYIVVWVTSNVGLIVHLSTYTACSSLCLHMWMLCQENGLEIPEIEDGVERFIEVIG